MPLFAIAGGLAHALSKTHIEYLPRALIIVDCDTGLIVHVEENVACREEVFSVCARFGIEHEAAGEGRKIRFLKRGEFLCPGFVDTHTHAPQYPNIGTGGQYQLLDWLVNVTFPREAKFSDVAYAKKVYERVARRTLDLGTTTSCYYGSLHLEATKALADVVHAAGQRAFVGKCNMDRNSPPSYIEPSAQASLDDTISLITHIRSLPPHSPSVRSSMTPPLSPPASAGTSCPPSTSSPHQILPPLPNHLNNSLSSPRSCLSLPSQPPLVQPILTPRFAISTTPQLLSHLHSLITSEAAKGTPLHVQTHLCENHNEIAFTKELFAKPDARELMRECLKRRAGVSGDGNEEWDGTYTGVYDAFGLLGERTVLAHCVHLTSSELHTLSRTNSGISHCPTSNLNIRSGLCKVGDLLDRGLNVGLGTDCSGGYESGILSQIRAAGVTSKLVSMLPKGHGAREQDGVKGKGKEGNGNGSTEKEEDDSPVLAPLVTAPSAHASSPGVDPKTGPLFGTFGSLVQLPMATLFFLGTQGGADVCGLGQTIGSLETGKEYDALLVDVRNYRGAVGVWWDDDEHGEEREGEGDGEGWGWRDEEDLRGAFEKWVWAGDDRNLARVWVRGREVGGKDWVNEREKA